MDKVLRILQINVVGKTLSTGRTVWEMHEYFLANGISSYIATATGSECHCAYPISNKVGIKIDIIKSIMTGLEAYANKRNTKKLLRYIGTIKPNIVHLRNLHQSYVNLGLLLKYLAKKDIATVITLHDSWFFTGKCCSYNIFNCEKWIEGCGSCPALSSDLKRRLFDRTHRMWLDKKRWFCSIPRLAVIGNSKWTMESAKRSFLGKAKIIDYIYNWIDTKIFYPKESIGLRKQLGLNEKKVIIAVSAFWTLRGTKGLNTYLNLAKEMPNEYCIILIGKAEQGIVLPSNVMQIDFIDSGSILADYYSMADVYLNVSESETFGKSAAEAVCCGTPVIALNRTANPEIVPEGAGALIETSEPDEILPALNEIFSKPKEYYLKKCLSYAEKNFNKVTNIKKYLDIYYNLLGN